uniref:Uncharacterized protein n=1 Tax=Timema tahoe TaxID=61484 RepID=A0A7R9FEX4_9NEOP|nr:unnamed protein product [Timema tahoe]
MKKAELKESVLAFVWREKVGNRLEKYTQPGSNHNLPVLSSLVYCESSTSDHASPERSTVKNANSPSGFPESGHASGGLRAQTPCSQSVLSSSMTCMSSVAAKRIFRELNLLSRCEDLRKCHIHVELRNDDFSRLKGMVRGPPDTVYDMGDFELDIVVPDSYPFIPPKVLGRGHGVVKFKTPVWHPNISSATGSICLDVLQEEWVASMCLQTIMLSIQLLLANPEPESAQVRYYYVVHDMGCSVTTATGRCVSESVTCSLPSQDAVVARQFRMNPSCFDMTARYWTALYAGGPYRNEEFQEKVRKLVNMGVDERESCVTLSSCDWCLETAVAKLF